MGLLRLEHAKSTYRADMVFYGIAVLALLAVVLASGAHQRLLTSAALALTGLAAWTGIEYGLHRFVMHGLQPFRGWHAQHHQRPMALICTPTLVSASLITSLVFLPALAVASLWPACALTLGVLTGYLAYSIVHDATHHRRTGSAWLKERKRWHALHHHHADQPGCYGVTSSFWDHLLGTGPARSPPPATSPSREEVSMISNNVAQTHRNLSLASHEPSTSYGRAMSATEGNREASRALKALAWVFPRATALRGDRAEEGTGGAEKISASPLFVDTEASWTLR